MSNKKPSEEAKEPDMEAELIVGVVIDTEEKFSALMKYLGLPNTGKVHPLKVVPMKDSMTSIRMESMVVGTPLVLPLSKEDVEVCRNCDKVQRNGFGGLVLTDEGQGQCYYGGDVELDKHSCNAWGLVNNGKLAKDTTRTRADKPESETR